MSLRVASIAAAAALAAAAAFGCGSNSDSKAGTDGSASQAQSADSPAPPESSESPASGRQSARRVRGIRLLRVGSFDQPTYITAPPGDRKRRFVVEREGRVRVVRGRRKLGTPFLDIAGEVETGGESGMLSMAFPPDYKSSGLFYVYYVDNGGAIRIDQFKRSGGNPDRADPDSRRLVIRQPHPRFNHKGGQLQFGPDGLLYTGFGDGGAGNDPDRNAQNRNRLLGKLLRIDPKPGGGYRIPRSNPYASTGGRRGEIFAYGLRNPYRFSFDRRTGSLAIGDVGQDAVEEVDFLKARKRGQPVRKGVNFGWPAFEGRKRIESSSAPGHVLPVLQRTHDQGFCSITGGYVIRDRTMGRFRGRYVYGDLCDPKLRIAHLRRGRARGDRALGPRVSQLVSFGEDARGRVHAVSLDGPVYRLAPRR